MYVYYNIIMYYVLYMFIREDCIHTARDDYVITHIGRFR